MGYEILRSAQNDSGGGQFDEGRTMHVVLSTHKIKPEHLDEYLASMRAYAAVCAAEPGCVRYEVLQDLAEPTVVCLYEVFRDAEAFAAHQRSEHHERWMARSAGWREVSPMARHELDFVYPESE